MEDSLLSPMSFAMLSGAGLIKGRKQSDTRDAQKIYTHATYDMVAEMIDDVISVKLTDEDRNGATLVVSKEAPIYPITLDNAGAQANFLSAVTQKQVFVKAEGTADSALEPVEVSDRGEVINADGKSIVFQLVTDRSSPEDPRQDDGTVRPGDTVRIDCYEVHDEGAYEMQIDADNFAGYYYIEASTLFRDEATGADLPAEFVIPRGKIQSNFTFSMSNTGDPSTSSIVGVAA